MQPFRHTQITNNPGYYLRENPQGRGLNPTLNRGGGIERARVVNNTRVIGKNVPTPQPFLGLANTPRDRDRVESAAVRRIRSRRRFGK